MERGGAGTTVPETTSLFPVRPQSSTGDEDNAPEWLRNTSFTTDLTLINDAVSTHYQQSQLEELSSEEDEERAEKSKEKLPRPQYELIDSSASGRGSYSDDEEMKEKRRNRKRKKKKRRRRELSSNAASLHEYGLASSSSSSRKADIRAWASSTSDTTGSTKEYYFDSKGDRDNLAFGCIYRMDVARYKLKNSRKFSDLSFYRRSRKSSVLDGDDDIDGLDGKLRLEGRYWSAMFAALERHKNLKRIRVLAPQKIVPTVAAEFIPLSDDGGPNFRSSGDKVVEESWEDEVYRKTKEFNKLTREKPHDEKAWLAFADFQDKVARMQPQKGARLQTLEKKISILEKATELNPDNEDLVLSLMKAYQSRDSTDVLIGRWEKILVQNSGSHRLWKEFLQVIQGEFSRFKISEMRKMYTNAVQALSGACSKQYRQVQRHTTGPSSDPELVRLELGLVDIFLSLCHFEWQAGYHELATALFQAEIEYTLFCPSLLLSEQSKRRLFEHFWNSNGARVGEDGALGWSTWLGKEEEQRQKIVNEELSHKAEEGGWTGWSDPPSKTKDMMEALENDRVSDMAIEESGDVSDARDDEQDDDTEVLLKKLGIDASADANNEIKDTKTWTKWSEEELARDSDQWMPVRTRSAGAPHHDDAEADEQLLRVILYEDVTDYLFTLISEEARLSLVSQFVEFFGGRISQWACTNSSSWDGTTRSLDAFSYSILDNLRKVHDILTEKQSIPMSMPLECLLSSSDDISMRSSMMKFVRNASLLCLSALPQNYVLEEAVLVAEELSNTRMNSLVSPVTPCRALAKSLLKNNRQDVLLCGVYARREAVSGNIDQARKIFDMALLSVGGLPLDVQSNASLLYLWYAEMEISNTSFDRSESSLRAVHILSCLGCGEKYTPYSRQASSLQQLRARQGFKERIRMLGPLWARGRIDDFSTAVICSAALFEELTTGPAAAIEILDQAFTMVLPERRRQSYQLEFLFNYYVKILCKYHQEMRFSEIWDAIVKGLQMYPFSPYLYSALVEISHLHTSPNKLRWILDDFCSKKPSIVAFFFSLLFEMSKGGLQHRIRAIFERALENAAFRNVVVLWRCYIAYESVVAHDFSAARRVFFRAIHACPWSKKLWLDGFLRLNSVLTAKELSDLQEVMRDKELNLRTDIYEILLQDEMEI
nr:protein NRDE2 homolog [Coffea arabica]